MDINDVKKAYQEHDKYQTAVDDLVKKCLQAARSGETTYSSRDDDTYFIGQDVWKIAKRLRERGFGEKVWVHTDSTYYIDIYGWG